MAYQVLARKWRPRKFADLVGQEHVVGALVNALKLSRLHHAYLLTGTRGVGKTTIARILAKSLNCQQVNDGEPCCQCDVCQQIDAGRFVDVLEIDAASNTGIDNIREVLDNAQYAPTTGQYKVYIIDEVHMLSKSAFNAMLKTLEEPPEHVKFILATTDPHKVPITVLSRCLQFVLRNLTIQQVSGHLFNVLTAENIAFDERALQLLSRAASGSMRDALSLLDQSIALGSGQVREETVRQMLGAVDRQYLFQLLNCIAQQDAAGVMDKAQEMSQRAVGFDNALNECAALLQELAQIKAVPTSLLEENLEFQSLKQLSELLSAEALQLYYQCAIYGKKDLHLAPDEYAGFLMTLLRMLSFAPIASNDITLDQQIDNTELHNPKSNTVVEQNQQRQQMEQDTKLTTAAALQSATIKSSLNVAVEENVTEDVLVEEPIVEQAVVADIAVEEAIVEQTVVADMAVEEAIVEQAVVADIAVVEPVAEQAVVTDLAVVETPAVEEQNLSVDNKVVNIIDNNVTVEQATENEKVSLPILNSENWVAIVGGLTRDLASASWVANHTALVSVDGNKLAISVNTEATSLVNQQRLDTLVDVLKHTYQLEQVDIKEWQQDFQSAHQGILEKQEQDKKLARQYLQNSEQAQKIQSVFGAQWHPESIQLITK